MIRPFTFEGKPGEEDDLRDLDVTVACRPRSEPVTMPVSPTIVVAIAVVTVIADLVTCRPKT